MFLSKQYNCLDVKVDKFRIPARASWHHQIGALFIPFASSTASSSASWRVSFYSLKLASVHIRTGFHYHAGPWPLQLHPWHIYDTTIISTTTKKVGTRYTIPISQGGLAIGIIRIIYLENNYEICFEREGTRLIMSNIHPIYQHIVAIYSSVLFVVFTLDWIFTITKRM